MISNEKNWLQCCHGGPMQYTLHRARNILRPACTDLNETHRNSYCNRAYHWTTYSYKHLADYQLMPMGQPTSFIFAQNYKRMNCNWQNYSCCTPWHDGTWNLPVYLLLFLQENLPVYLRCLNSVSFWSGLNSIFQTTCHTFFVPGWSTPDHVFTLLGSRNLNDCYDNNSAKCQNNQTELCCEINYKICN